MIQPAGDHSVMFAGNMSGSATCVIIYTILYKCWGHITVPVCPHIVSTGRNALSSLVYHFENSCLTLMPACLRICLSVLRITYSYVILLDRN